MPQEFKPGEKVKKSGIYKVIHQPGSHVVSDHEVTCVAGKPFPPCNDCSENVRFTLVRAARSVVTHDLFS